MLIGQERSDSFKAFSKHNWVFSICRVTQKEERAPHLSPVTDITNGLPLKRPGNRKSMTT